MSFSQKTKDRINGWGSVFRFITPLLLSLILFILSDVRSQIRDVKLEAKEGFKIVDMQFDKVNLQFSNHLEHHRQFEIVLAERLTTIETTIRNWR